MDISLFDFDLPEDRIALRPAVPRDSARLLRITPDSDRLLADHVVSQLSDLLQPGDVLVSNDTKVIPARLFGQRGEAHVEVTLHMQIGATEWKVFSRPARKLRLGDTLQFDDVTAEVSAVGDAGERTLYFDVSAADMMPTLSRLGELPLPPYIASKRAVDDQDNDDYQTIFAQKEGAVAAPTAGLHFTPELLQRLDDRGVSRETITLHVGAGTFLPVKVDNTDDHVMHAEWGQITADVAQRLNKARKNGGRLIAVGTTSLRLLESAVRDDGVIQPFMDTTDIFITPGYKFKAVDMLMTNFHLPKSTLFMLVSAFAGLDEMQQAYAHAVAQNYRFYSYGDSSLLSLKALES